MPNAAANGRRHVLIVGVSTRAMAESAANAGFVVTSVDAFGDLDQAPGIRALSMPRDVGMEFSANAVADVARSIEADAVAYQSPFENHPSLIRQLADGKELWGNGPATLARCRDPRALPHLEATGSDRWLAKPRRSGGGHGVRWWNAGEPVPDDGYLQRYVDGVPGSIVFVAARGRSVPLGLTIQLVGDEAFGATGFRYCGSVLTSAEDPPDEWPWLHGGCRAGGRVLLASATTLAATMAREFELVGVNCIDFIARDDEAHAIEINPRWSASMELIERAYGFSVFGAHAAACAAGVLPTFDLASRRHASEAVGKAIIFAKHDVICRDTRSWLGDSNVRDVPHPAEEIARGRPVCTVFASGRTAVECRAALADRARRVYETLDAWSSVFT